MGKSQLDLLNIFNQVSDALKNNQSALNKADDYNHDHGDHMVEIFEVITQAMKDKKNADPADQLDYAAKLLRQKSSSGSAKIYANGLSKASKEFSGKQLDVGNILQLAQTLMGGAAAIQSATSKKTSTSSDMLSTLLSGLGGSAATSEQNQGLDLADLLGAGMSYMQAKQSGKGDLDALVGALVGTTEMANTPHRSQSSEIVANTIFQALGSMLNK